MPTCATCADPGIVHVTDVACTFGREICSVLHDLPSNPPQAVAYCRGLRAFIQASQASR